MVQNRAIVTSSSVYQSLYCCIMVRCSAVLMCPLKGKRDTDTHARTAQDTRKTVMHGLLNGAIFNYLERPQTHISRSGQSLMVNISEMAKVK